MTRAEGEEPDRDTGPIVTKAVVPHSEEECFGGGSITASIAASIITPSHSYRRRSASIVRIDNDDDDDDDATASEEETSIGDATRPSFLKCIGAQSKTVVPLALGDLTNFKIDESQLSLFSVCAGRLCRSLGFQVLLAH